MSNYGWISSVLHIRLVLTIVSLPSCNVVLYCIGMEHSKLANQYARIDMR